MGRTAIRSAAWIFTASVVAGCAGGVQSGGPEYRPVPLAEVTDPLAPPKTVAAWRPPRQMAVYIHPHEDSKQGILIGGHWIMLLLGEGSWYHESEIEREPVPDAEASPDEKRAALRAMSTPGDVVLPYRTREE